MKKLQKILLGVLSITLLTLPMFAFASSPDVDDLDECCDVRVHEGANTPVFNITEENNGTFSATVERDGEIIFSADNLTGDFDEVVEYAFNNVMTQSRCTHIPNAHDRVRGADIHFRRTDGWCDVFASYFWRCRGCNQLIGTAGTRFIHTHRH